jgi:serine/threonine protein kinase
MNRFKVTLPPIGQVADETCFKVVRKSDKKPGCLKVSKVITDSEEKARHQKEFQLLSIVKHKNAIEVYEGFWDEDCFCVFIEHSQGGSLTKFVGKTLIDEEVFWLFIEMSEGIQCIHQQKIIHRDLKPDSILLDSKNHVKICDFGFSRTIEKLSNHQSL